MRTWQRDTARLQRPLTRFPVLCARGSSAQEIVSRTHTRSEERGERGQRASLLDESSDFRDGPRHPLGDPSMGQMMRG